MSSRIYQVEGVTEISSLKWKHNDDPITIDDDESHDVFYSTEKADSGYTVKLNIKVPSARVAGIWELTVEDEKKYTGFCVVSSQPVVRPRFGAVRGHEGYPLSVVCETDGYPVAEKVTWMQFDKSEHKRVHVTNANFKSHGNIIDAVMEWSDASNASGLYLCTTSSDTSLLFEVRIKSKFAALWPLLGIAAEAIVLILIILLYELSQRKRRRAEENNALLKSNNKAE